MLATPSENDVKHILSAVRGALTARPPAPAGDLSAAVDDEAAGEPVAAVSAWRSVLRHLPRDLDYVHPDNVIDDELKCPVCLGWLLDPVALGCPAGHLLCRACAGSLRERICPLDRHAFVDTSFAEKNVIARLDGLQVRCPFAAAGCCWTGNRSDVIEHCSSCIHALVECRQCGAHVRRREQAAHMHAFEVGACVRWTRCGGVGHVLRVDLSSEVVQVRFSTGVRECPRCELVRASPESTAPDDQAQRRLAQIDSVLNIYEQAERINLCFVVDCTGSMRSHIQSVNRQIFSIVREMSARLPSMQLHVAFVGYRDHGDATRLEICPFTTSVEDFRNFVGSVGAWGCGGDIPEDVLGGLNAASNLQWDVGGAATRVLIHMGDAPCHGHHYQERSCFTHKDNYPDGDPEGLEPAALLSRLKDLNVQYVFGRINGTTDKMIRLFNEEAGGEYIQSRELRDASLVSATVTASLQASVATTVSTLAAAEGGLSRRVRTSDEVPIWRDVKMIDVELRRHLPFESIDDLRRPPSATAPRVAVGGSRVQLAPLPFSQGETRTARFALVEGREPAVAKHMKRSFHAASETGDDLSDDEEDTAAALDEMLALSEVSAVASFLADRFTSQYDGDVSIRFLESHVAIPSSGGTPFNLEDQLPAAEFQRFSNNIGWWEPGADETLMKFMRWTHEATDGYMMVVDLQGVRTEHGFVLTDPCILCADVTRFGNGNLGPRALQRCLASLTARLDQPLITEEPHVPESSYVYIPTTCSPATPLAPFVPAKLTWQERCEELVRPPEPSAGALSTVGNKATEALSAALNKVGMRKEKSTDVHVWSREETLDVDSLLSALLLPFRSFRSAKLPGEQQIRPMLAAARQIILAQPSLLELDAPITILGDIHGQYSDLLRYFELDDVTKSGYLMLGDYVDRGRQSLEVMTLLLALKVKYPENVFLLRGNHECASITRIYGFYDECKRRYNIKLWKAFCDVFNCLPVAAVVSERIFCCHGGLSPELRHLDDVRRVLRPSDVPDTGLVCDLLWADPDDDINGWAENDRGVSYRFGADVAARFLTACDLDLVVRAHQVVEDGYEFFGGRRLVTLFSAPNYTGEFDNAGAAIRVTDELKCSFVRLLPAYSGSSTS
eukprot:TRINITY_DN450_c1_g1_i1.p1 TRINITY_DN450_c1_g1~~TRINITY_DN450_c1_g1_i1.p1  ORF type:complete len:1127 (-),score=178.94 TRINITY_DN450_c1_g1_i1:182-3562(-)